MATKRTRVTYLAAICAATTALTTPPNQALPPDQRCQITHVTTPPTLCSQLPTITLSCPQATPNSLRLC